MTHRPLNIRQGMIAGGVLSLFFVVLTVVSSTPGTRVTAGLLVVGTCAVMLTLVLLVLRAANSRGPHRL